MLVVDHVSHRFGDRLVLDDINLKVAEGEILAIMGASGGGKTTLLRCITGLLTPSEGDIIVDEVSVRKNPELVRQRLGIVFQSAALFDYLNVEQNVSFGVERQKKLRGRALAEHVQQMLELVGLQDSAKLMPSELSGGMRKRVGLARALAMEPAIVLYDEPTSGLDPVTAYAIDSLIVGMREKLGITSVVVSHDLSSVFRVADQIAFLERGELTYYGDPAGFRSSQNEAINNLVRKARAETFI
ncbi:MAG: ATP-binding cassette domain-containing protein [Chthonomonas sp.]|nr:ATP-binding cassette domain-containing protein [Chthonomonas sp.]